LNLSIARGLDYYTGIVYETTLDAYPQIGSICSGGRYDDLASHYTKSRLPGVGISIGLTRLFFQLRDAGIVSAVDSSVDVLVALLDEAGLDHALALSQRLRASGFNVETQLEPRKLARQLQYADRAGIRFVVIRGEDEAARGMVAVKDLRRGEQSEVAEDALAQGAAGCTRAAARHSGAGSGGERTMSAVIRLDGNSLTRAQLVAVARGTSVELDEGALRPSRKQRNSWRRRCNARSRSTAYRPDSAATPTSCSAAIRCAMPRSTRRRRDVRCTSNCRTT
jgi:hypothetical protein